MDLKNPRQDSANFSHNQNCADVSTKNVNKKKIFKIFGAGTLAMMMGIGTLCGVLISPANLAQASISSEPKTSTTSPLGLDPENDPVIYTTDYGLEIKSHNASGLAFEEVTQGDGTSNTSWLNGYSYISAGGYNWVIIGQYSTSTYTFTSTFPGNKYSYLESDGTPAGDSISINSKRPQAEVQLSVTIPSFPKAVVPENGEIPIGCVYCLCETFMPDDIVFGSPNTYINSTQQSYMNNTVYGEDTDLGKALRALPIEPQNLETICSGTWGTVENAYVFPVASENTDESFHIGTYLTTSEARKVNVTYWTRSGFSRSGYSQGGQIYKDGNYDNTPYHGSWTAKPRPSFVLRLYGI